MGDDDKDKVDVEILPDDGPFVVRAFIARDDTLPPGVFGKNTVTFMHIYNNSPANARYAVLTYKGRVKVVDLYESEVMMSPTPRVIPKWVEGNWIGVHHAIAAMCIGYGDGPHHNIKEGRSRLIEYSLRSFNQTFDHLTK